MWNKRRNRMAPTPQNFGKLAGVYSGKLDQVSPGFQPQEWENFIKRTVAHARAQVIAYAYVDADTRAQWALENSSEHQGYLDWCRVLEEYGDRG